MKETAKNKCPKSFESLYNVSSVLCLLAIVFLSATMISLAFIQDFENIVMQVMLGSSIGSLLLFSSFHLMITILSYYRQRKNNNWGTAMDCIITKIENTKIEDFFLPESRQVYTGAYRHQLDLDLPIVKEYYRQYIEFRNIDYIRTGKEYKQFEDCVFSAYTSKI